MTRIKWQDGDDNMAAVADIAFEELRCGPLRFSANSTLITFANAMEGQFFMEEYYS